MRLRLPSFLARLFTPPTPAPAADAGPLIHIHEDDWGMRNLYPAAAHAEAASDIEAARQSGEDHFDGVGWTDIHAIQPPSHTFVDAGLRLADAAAALSPILPRVRRFNATIGSMIGAAGRDPYGSYETDAWCYALSADCFVKLEPDGELVRAIWFEAKAEIDTLRRALAALDRLTPCVVADYWLDLAGPLSDPAFADRYFEALK